MQAKSGRNNGPFHWLEKRLWRSGVQDPTIREILCWQISVIALSLLFGAVLWPFHPAGAWIFWFGFGALLSAWNFFALLKFVPKVISAGCPSPPREHETFIYRNFVVHGSGMV